MGERKKEEQLKKARRFRSLSFLRDIIFMQQVRACTWHCALVQN